MGTSSSNTGPGPGGGLLPPDAPPPPEPTDEGPNDQDTQDTPEDEQEAPSPPEQDWGRVKTHMSNFGRTGSRKSLGKAARGFVSAQGGSGGASAASPTGRATARNLSRFMTGAVRDGLSRTAEWLGVADYLGSDAQTFLAALAVHLVPRAGGDEEDVARRAIARTLARLFEEVGVADASFEALEDLDSDTIATVLRVYVVEYINGRLMQVLETRVISRAIDEEDALQKEETVKDYVRVRVRGAIGQRNPMEVDWRSDEGDQVIDEIFRDAYRLLGDQP